MRYCSECGSRLGHSPPVTCEQCGASHYRNAKPCAGALITCHGELLLIKRAHEPWGGRWDIPGGFCEYDEHPEQTAIREVREETGLEIAITEFFGMWLDHYAGEETTLNIYFRAEVRGGEELPQPGEVSELRWFGPHDLPGRDDLAFPDHAAEVLAALQ